MNDVVQCLATSRSVRGYERCHRQAGHDGEHHASDRAWAQTWYNTPGLRFGVPCDEGCVFTEDVVPYFGVESQVSGRLAQQLRPLHKRRKREG